MVRVPEGCPGASWVKRCSSSRFGKNLNRVAPNMPNRKAYIWWEANKCLFAQENCRLPHIFLLLLKLILGTSNSNPNHCMMQQPQLEDWLLGKPPLAFHITCWHPNGWKIFNIQQMEGTLETSCTRVTRTNNRTACIDCFLHVPRDCLA